MNNTSYKYEIQIPLNGNPGQFWTIVTALTAQSAAEVVHILLAQGDAQLTEIRVLPRLVL